MTLRHGLVLCLIALCASASPGKAQDATRCVEARGFARNARLQNTCNFDINVRICCDGEGALADCSGGDAVIAALEPSESILPGSCNGDVYWISCRAPEAPTERVYWENGELFYYRPMCVSVPSSDS